MFSFIKTLFNNPKPYRIPKTWNNLSYYGLIVKPTIKSNRVFFLKTKMTTIMKDDLILINLGLLTTLGKVINVNTLPVANCRPDYLVSGRIILSKQCRLCSRYFEIESNLDKCPICKAND